MHGLRLREITGGTYIPGQEEILYLAHGLEKFFMGGNIYPQAMKKFYAWPTS